MAPWWENLDYQSKGQFNQRHPGVTPTWVYDFTMLQLVWIMLLEGSCSLTYALFIWMFGHGVSRFILSIVFWVSSGALINLLLIVPRRRELALVGNLLHQALVLSLAIASSIIEAVEKDMFLFAFAFIWTMVTLAGALGASFLYWKMSVAKISIGTSDLSDFVPYTNEEPYQDEDGPLARHYNNLDLQAQPDLSLGELESNSLVTENLSDTSIPDRGRTEPEPAREDGSSTTPTVRLNKANMPPRLPLMAQSAPTGAFADLLFALLLGLLLELLAICMAWASSGGGLPLYW
ncbi:hypothetical protein CEP51_001058 [Fusarium floridanum]|uniref:Uncharacterized protein n=1 Tax=Fusarium floridanum TaxID=1325733 RepID=A0A428SIX3_9HYPO|nr:hypothetical protein CEP51_001058 [Fusarium floridanum]